MISRSRWEGSARTSASCCRRGWSRHSFEPKPGDVLKLEGGDLFIYTGRQMEPWAERILRGVNTKRLVVVDASAGILPGEDKAPYILSGKPPGDSGDQHYHPGVDPHIWLDLGNARKMVDTILAGFVLRTRTTRSITRGMQKSIRRNSRIWMPNISAR